MQVSVGDIDLEITFLCIIIKPFKLVCRGYKWCAGAMLPQDISRDAEAEEIVIYSIAKVTNMDDVE